MFSFRGVLLALLVSLSLSGCDTGIREMGPNEVGVVFRRLPTLLGGGLSNEVIGRGEKRIVFPWDEIYRFTTAPRYVTWGKSAPNSEAAIYSRARDGNEVALNVTIAYQLSSDPSIITRLAQEVTVTDQGIEDLVIASARSDVRTYMNRLETLEFRQTKLRDDAIDAVKASMNKRLNKFGIQVITVNLDDFQFKRLSLDGKEDSTYQKMIDQIQAKIEDTKGKIAEKDTVKASKEIELRGIEAKRVSLTKEGEGYKKAMVFRGDAYFETKSNEAKGILALGKAEVEGLSEQISALSGPGGQAILKLEITKQMLKNDPRFVLMAESKEGSAMQVKRTDTNELIQQMGLMDALGDSKAQPKRERIENEARRPAQP